MDVSLEVMWWLLVNADCRPPAVGTISTMGSGPLDEHHFDAVLHGLELPVYEPTEATDVLVLGREGWSERFIESLLDKRSGLTLSVYSQDMFIAYLISGQDPLAQDEATVRRLAGDHPALSYLDAVGFQWPSTQVPPRGRGKLDVELLRLGFLKYNGYTVGKAGLAAEGRQQRLELAYEGIVPDDFPSNYVSEWGQPSSSKRLKKMAETIAALCRNNKKKGRPSPLSIAEWEADLAWLRATLYEGRFRFRWPSTDVW